MFFPQRLTNSRVSLSSLPICWPSSKPRDTFLPQGQGGIRKWGFSKNVLVVLEMRWILTRSAEKLLGTSDYLLDNLDSLLAFSQPCNATVTLHRIYMVRTSGSTRTKEEDQPAGVGLSTTCQPRVQLFAVVVNNHDHPPLEPTTTKIVVGWWQLLDGPLPFRLPPIGPVGGSPIGGSLNRSGPF